MSNVTKIVIVLDLPTSLHVFMCAAAIILNSFVLVVIWKDPKKCLRTRSAMLITSLIISDLLVAVISVARILCQALDLLPHSQRFFILVLIVGFYDALMISFFTIFLISVEHLLAITQPIKFKILVTKKWISVIIISTWLGCTAMLTMIFHVPGPYNKLFHSITACSVLLFIALPTIYARSLLSLRQQSRAIKGMDGCSMKLETQKRIAQQRNFLLTSAVLLLANVLTCAPFTFRHYLKTSQNANYNMHEERDSLAVFLWTILHFNLILDPFLYCLRIPQYRKSCAALICKKV